jgi:hypothetical protein
VILCQSKEKHFLIPKSHLPVDVEIGGRSVG